MHGVHTKNTIPGKYAHLKPSQRLNNIKTKKIKQNETSKIEATIMLHSINIEIDSQF